MPIEKFEEILQYFRSNAEDLKVRVFLEGVSRPAELTLKRVQAFVQEDSAARSWIDSQKDKHFNKALKTWKENNLQRIVEEEIKNRYLKTEPEAMGVTIMMLDEVKLLLGIESTDTSKDELLKLHLRKAVTGIKNYLNVESDVGNLYPDAVMELAAYFYRHAGEENTNCEMQGKRLRMTRKYTSLPEYIKNLLPSPFVKIVG